MRITERRPLLLAGYVLGIALISFPQVGCSDSGSDHTCTANAIAALTVTVLDSSGARVCDATVVAHDGTFSETLMSLDYDTSCTYAGAWERRGTYTIDVASGSKSKTVSNIVVTGDECHVNGQVLTVTLDP
jgi:hypothetical protein